MKNMTKCISYLIGLLLFSLIIFVSCEKETPFEPPSSEYQFDSARFRWKVTQLPPSWGYSRFFYAIDTNEVLLCDRLAKCYIHIKGENYTLINYPQDVYGGLIEKIGSDIYFLGGIEKEETTYPYFAKWNGNNFVNTPVNYTYFKKYRLGRALVINTNEVWIAGTGIVYKFDGYNFNYYPLPDTTFFPMALIKDEDNKIKVLSGWWNSALDSMAYTRLYEFTGNEFVKVWEDVYPVATKGFYQMGNIIYVAAATGPSYDMGIFQLKNNTLNLVFVNQPYIGFIPGSFGGSSLTNDLMAFGFENKVGPNIFHFNGNKWSKENIKYDYHDRLVKKFSDNYYCAFCYDNYGACFMRGIKK